MDGMIKSKVTRNSDNADVLREACRKAAADGRAFSIVESFTSGDWWTEFSIQPEITHVTFDSTLMFQQEMPK